MDRVEVAVSKKNESFRLCVDYRDLGEPFQASHVL